MIARGRKGPGSMASRDSCVSLPFWLNRQGADSFCIQCNVLSRFPVGGNRHTVIASLQLSATDVSARTTMKGAAKCDKHCDLQNSVNQQGFERILRFRDIPESMPASESTLVSCSRRASQLLVVELGVSAVRFCAPRCLVLPLMHEVHVVTLGTQLTEHHLVHCLLLLLWWPRCPSLASSALPWL